VAGCPFWGGDSPCADAGKRKAAAGRDRQQGGSAHFHNTRSPAQANASRFGGRGHRIRRFEGGIGGSPYASGATGIVVTEDLVFLSGLLQQGVNLEAPCFKKTFGNEC